MQLVLKAEMIDESDAWGLSTIDFVQRGADCFFNFTCREWKTAPIAAMWGALTGVMGQLASAAAPIGRLGSALATPFVMTGTANTPAAASPATLTAAQAVLAPNFNVEAAFDSRLRELPIRFLLLPYGTNPTVWFTTT